MRRLVVFMHTSLDGFVAGTHGEMDWINVDEEIFDYAGQRTNEADTALYGRVTFQMMESYWPTAGDQPAATKHDIEHSKWYNKAAKVVVSNSMQGQSTAHTKIIGKNLAHEVNEVKQQAGKDILMFGSPTAAHALMHLDLIDDYWIFVNPVLLGEGIPMFGGIKENTKLRLLESNTFTSGVVCLHYGRQRDR